MVKMKNKLRRLLVVCWRNVYNKPKNILAYCATIHNFNKDTYFPDKPLKGNLQIVLEQLWHIFRYGNVCEDYFFYGFDVKGKSKNDYVTSYFQFMIRRNELNLSSFHNSTCILRNKFYFGIYTKALGIKTPANIAIYRNNILFDLKNKISTTVEAFFSKNAELDIFAKPFDGECGGGIFHVYVQNGSLFMGGQKTTIEKIIDLINNKTYLFQQKFVQHSNMLEIYPHSVNTIRLMTVRYKNEIHVFSAVLRIGANGNEVDNYSKGGVIVEINKETGELEKWGLQKQGYGKISACHPNTHFKYEGFVIPFWKEAVEQAKFYHDMLSDIHSIGWDVAISENGPVFIEGNDNWEIPLAQMNSGVKKMYDKYFYNI